MWKPLCLESLCAIGASSDAAALLTRCWRRIGGDARGEGLLFGACCKICALDRVLPNYSEGTYC